MTDQDIINYFWGNKTVLKSSKLLNIPQDIIDYLNNRYNDSLSTLETINRIKIGIDVHPICPICKHNLVQYKGRYLSKNIFQMTCNNLECIKKYKGYGSKLTKQQRYGDPNYNNSLKMKQTKLERYGDSGYHNIEKMKETCLERYGCENGGGTKQSLEKIKQTKIERYGDENYTNREKIKQTKLERYGDENYTNREKAVKNTDYSKRQIKIKETCLKKYGLTNGGGSKQSLEKSKETCLKKYNSEYFFNSKYFIDKFKKTLQIKYGVDSPLKSEQIKSKLNYKEIINKGYQTKKINNSFGKSQPEEKIYNLLLTKFNNVIRQYKSKTYPFCCDFYIPVIDLYIEYQGFWTHGKHPYDKNNIYDQQILNNWKEKNNGFYNNAINVWTISDVNKRNIAKQNNLNYLEFFTIKDFYNWFSNI